MAAASVLLPVTAATGGIAVPVAPQGRRPGNSDGGLQPLTGLPGSPQGDPSKYWL